MGLKSAGNLSLNDIGIQEVLENHLAREASWIVPNVRQIYGIKLQTNILYVTSNK